MSIVYGANVTDGLFPEHWDGETGQPIGSRCASRLPCSGSNKFAALDHITAGAAVDSGYEYILKQYLLTGDIKARDQCKRFSFVSIICVLISNKPHQISHRQTESSTI